MSPSDIGVAAATRLWRKWGRRSVINRATYQAALERLAKETGDPPLWQATQSRQLLSPLGRRK